jgi:hypothetical protein
MTQDDSVHSTSATSPVDPTRRSFLSQAAGVTAGGAVLAAATITVSAAAAPAGLPDPVFGLIAVHAEIVETVHRIESELSWLHEHNMPSEDVYDGIAEPAQAELELFLELLETVPTTLMGVVALVAHLDQVRQEDPWKFEDNYATPLIGALAAAFNRMAVTS